MMETQQKRNFLLMESLLELSLPQPSSDLVALPSPFGCNQMAQNNESGLVLNTVQVRFMKKFSIQISFRCNICLGNFSSILIYIVLQFHEELKKGKLTNARNGPLIQACTTMFYEVSNKYVNSDTLINNQHNTRRESRDGWYQIC